MLIIRMLPMPSAMSRLLVRCLLLACALTAGCAAPVYEDRLPWADGWRLGKVSRVETLKDDSAFYSRRCSKRPEVAPSQVAVVEWRQVGRLRWQTAPIPADVTVAAGESVYVNGWDCAAALVKRKQD
ncbi:hypothetical protein LJR066_006716 [Acidovorax sp. LjRoot66]|uniref:hypothetical protein n=1 Tax=Acidovorax sp. LjRoot66 TaxID=3342334 RepID=UPI003ED02A1F